MEPSEREAEEEAKEHELVESLSLHKSVLLSEAVDGLNVELSDTIVDATLGGAGHFSTLLQKLGPNGTIVGIDADSDALDRAKAAMVKASTTVRVELTHDNFRNLDTILSNLGIEYINKSLFDLGWSGYQLTRGRGFSFQTDEPLHMTYGDPEKQQTAADVVNGVPEDELVKMLFELGEEQFARRISRGIVEARKRERIETTTELVRIITDATPVWYQHRRINPATKTFQALRMYVNDELGALREGLGAAIAHTAPGGRIAVITFHSIEDRIVKNMFRDQVQEGNGFLASKKPIIPGPTELSQNPRARSAKLRILELAQDAIF